MRYTTSHQSALKYFPLILVDMQGTKHEKSYIIQFTFESITDVYSHWKYIIIGVSDHHLSSKYISTSASNPIRILQ